MTLKAKTLLLMARYLFFAALLIIAILYTASQLAKALDGASRADSYNIRVRIITYGEVER